MLKSPNYTHFGYFSQYRFFLFFLVFWVFSPKVFSQYKGDLALQVAIGYRTDEIVPGLPLSAPANRYHDLNDGYLRYWMGGLTLEAGAARSFFKKTLSGLSIRPSFHYIQGDRFVMANATLYHDWYYHQNNVDHRWLFGLHATNNGNRVASSGRPIFQGGPVVPGFNYRSLGLGVRGGRLLSQKGLLEDTYLRGELTWIIGRPNRYPEAQMFQFGLFLSRNAVINKRSKLR